MSKALQVILRFRTAEERDFFMGQLTDGFGENEADVRRICANTYSVDPTISDYWEHGRESAYKARMAERIRKAKETP